MSDDKEAQVWIHPKLPNTSVILYDGYVWLRVKRGASVIERNDALDIAERLDLEVIV